MSSETHGIFKKEYREVDDQNSQKKYKTPNRNRQVNSSAQSKFVECLKESVFQVARDQENYSSPCKASSRGGSPSKYTPTRSGFAQEPALGDATNIAFGRTSSRASIGQIAGVQITTIPQSCSSFATVDQSRPESPAKLVV